MKLENKNVKTNVAPIITLLLLAPIISEVLSGSTRLTTLFVLIPEIGTWGCGALMIRYAVRRLHRNWMAILLLGIALALAEECVIQQTSLSPLIGIDPNQVYGRALGVNWVYLLWALGYESIWVVVLPIQLTELIFPTRRDDPWVGTRGLIISAIFFVLAAFMAWYSWTQVFLPRYYPASVYYPPLSSIVIALVVIVVLVIVALFWPPLSQALPQSPHPAPQPWLVGLVAFVLALPWYLIVLLAYGALKVLPPVIVIVAGLILAAFTFFLIRRWASNLTWQDSHRLALIFGTIIATMVGGFIVLTVGKALLIDRIGQVVFNLIAVVLLILLARNIQRRPV